jgi:hypothetical protein
MRKEKSNYLPDILLILFTPKMPSEGATKTIQISIHVSKKDSEKVFPIQLCITI